jgi:hypothetical protein
MGKGNAARQVSKAKAAIKRLNARWPEWKDSNAWTPLALLGTGRPVASADV